MAQLVQLVPPKELQSRKENAEALARKVSDRFGIPHGEPGRKLVIEPQFGINYNEETITYTQHPVTANKIMDIIIKYYEYKNPDQANARNLTIITPTAGIGGDLITALDRPEVKFSLAYEMEPDRRNMLLNNLQAYGYDSKRYCIANIIDKNGQVSGKFTGVPSYLTPNMTIDSENKNDTNFVTLMMDPAWLVEVSGQDVHREDYARANLTIGPYSIEEWILRSFHCDMITLYVPLGYQLNMDKFVNVWGQSFNSIPDDLLSGLEYSKDLTRNNVRVTYTRIKIPDPNGNPHADLFVFIPIRTENKRLGPFTMISSNNSYEPFSMGDWNAEAPTPRCQTNAVRAITQYQAPEIPSGLQSLEQPVLTDLRIRAYEDAYNSARNADPKILLQWVNSLVSFLSSLLNSIGYSPNDIDILLSPKAIPIWVQAFTYKDVDEVNNYETLEFIGDKTLGSAFGIYMLKNISNANNDIMSNLTHIYMSRTKQPEYAEYLQIIPWMRIKTFVAIPEKVKGDAFESLAGAIMVICNLQDLGYPGLGHTLIEKLLEHIFAQKRFIIDMEYSKTTIQNRLPQLFQKLYLKDIDKKWDVKLAYKVDKRKIPETDVNYASTLYTMLITHEYDKRIAVLQKSLADIIGRTRPGYGPHILPSNHILGEYNEEATARSKSQAGLPNTLLYNSYNNLRSWGFDTLEFIMMANEQWTQEFDKRRSDFIKAVTYVQQLSFPDGARYDYIYFTAGANPKEAHMLAVNIQDRDNSRIIFMGKGNDKFSAYHNTLSLYVQEVVNESSLAASSS